MSSCHSDPAVAGEESRNISGRLLMGLNQRCFASLNMTASSKDVAYMNPIIRIFVILLSVLTASIASAADYPTPTEADFTIRDFKFASGETLPELRLH